MLLLTPPPYRACQLCSHGADHAGQRVCRCPAAVGRQAAVPVDLVRKPQGACGPEATHLDFPGLHA